MSRSPSIRWRNSWGYLAGPILCLIVTVLFYCEENWRGQRAWEACKRHVKGQGIELEWANYIPAAVPDDENFFAVPEMQRWFVGRGEEGWKDLCKNLSSTIYPGANIDSNTPRMLVAELTIGAPGAPKPDGAAVLRWDDPTSRAEAASLVTNALGPTATAPRSPIGIGLMLRRPEEVQPARIYLLCQSAPTETALQEFLPDSILHANTDLPERVIKIDPHGNGSYRVIMPVLGNVADCLAWSDQLEPQFGLIRQALQRPSARMQGDYGQPNFTPAPCFVTVRSFVQTLGARAECHFLLGQPEEALSELTLMHQSCHAIMEQNQPMTLLSAMINVAVRGLYAGTIAEGLRLQVWREPQLAALEEQLKTINLLPPVKQSLQLDAANTFHKLENAPWAGLVKKSFVGGLFPRGWGYQNMAARVNLDFDRVSSVDSASEIVVPKTFEDASESVYSLSRWSPYTFITALAPRNPKKVCQTTAHNQTEINQALVACALERYHLARGEYPKTLDALIPQCLDEIPRDVIGGKPPHYRRVADGTFMLYSIGWNGLDNGGVRGKSLRSMESDWVWPD